MPRDTKLLRLLLGLILVGLLMTGVMLYFVSTESARNWPELAPYQMPLYLAVLLGFVPVLGAVALAFDFLRMIDQGMAFSVQAAQILRRLELVIGAFAIYLAAFLVGAWAALGLMHLTLLLIWFAVEVAAMFLFAVASLFKRVILTASQMQADLAPTG